MTKTSYRECNPSPHRAPDLFLEVTMSLVPPTYLLAADGRMCHDSTVKCSLSSCVRVVVVWKVNGSLGAIIVRAISV